MKDWQPTSELLSEFTTATPSSALPILASPLALVPTKLPLSVLLCEPELISTPFAPLPDIRLPCGGTTKTGVVVPLLPVGSLIAPVAGSVKAMPPIWLPLAPPVNKRPLPPLAMAVVPVGSVPIRLQTSVLPDEPLKLMPLPPLPEMTLPTTPVASAGVQPDAVVGRCGSDEHAIARISSGGTGEVQADVVVVQRDVAGFQRYAVAIGVRHGHAKEL